MKAPSPTFQPLYLQIKGLLSRALEAGEWEPGAPIPAEVALGAAPPDRLQNGAIADVQGSGVGSDSGPANATPLVAGVVVTLTILLGGGGLLWWRNRDTAYWPA